MTAAAAAASQSSAAGMNSAVGPKNASRMGRNMRPLNRPNTISAVKTKKKYLKQKEKELRIEINNFELLSISSNHMAS